MKYRNPVQFHQREYFHIYNRSVNNEEVFSQEEVVEEFKAVVTKHLGLFADVVSYTIVPNHYHIVLKLKRLTPVLMKEIKKIKGAVPRRFLRNPNNNDYYSLFISSLFKSAWFQFSYFYNSLMDRKGPVMSSRFKRKNIDPAHVPYLIAYLHNNPRHHGFVEDLDQWKDSSHCDRNYQDWIQEFDKSSFEELAEGPGNGYKGNSGFYYRLLEVVNKIKSNSISKVPNEIWVELTELLQVKEEKRRELRKQTMYLINFERSLGDGK